jgi:hypothetical protein
MTLMSSRADLRGGPFTCPRITPPRRTPTHPRTSGRWHFGTFGLWEFAPPRRMDFLLQVLGHHGGNVEP